MKYCVLTHNEIEGIHFWKDAKPPVEYLKNPHRHIFIIKCKFKVKNNNRDIEIIKQQDKISIFFNDTFGRPAMFGQMSCEMIAECLLEFFKDCISCEVLEDGFGGAEVTR